MAPTDALKIAQGQFASGDLSDTNRESLLELTRQNIEAAGGDREAGLSATRDQLSKLSTPQTEDTTTTVINKTEPTGDVINPNVTKVSDTDVPGTQQDAFSTRPKVPEGTPTSLPATEDVTEEDTPLKSLDELDETFAGNLKDFFVGANEAGKTQGEALLLAKTRLQKAGFDVSDFDERFGDAIGEFQNLNLTSDDFFKKLRAGETFGKFFETNSADFAVAKENFNTFNELDKSSEGIYQALKNNALNPSIIAELNADPITSEFIKQANRRIADEDVNTTLNKSVADVLSMGQNELADFTQALMSKFGLNVNFSEKILEDKRINEAYDNYNTEYQKSLKLKGKIDGVRERIKNKFPNGSPSFINAMVSRETQALSDEYNDSIAAMGASKGAYDLRFGQMKEVMNRETAQSKIQIQTFSNLQKGQFDKFLVDYENANQTVQEEFQFLSQGSGVVARGNKLTGEIEFVDYKNIDKDETVTTVGGIKISTLGMDFRTSSMIDKYTGQAWAKNNNPAGITWDAASKALKNAWTEAGIDFKKGSGRPAEEGGNYVDFPSILDGIEGQEIALSRQGGDLTKRLMAWVGWCKTDECLVNRPDYTEENAESYAFGIQEDAGFGPQSMDIGKMSEEELDRIVVSQLRKESNGLYSELIKIGAVTEDGGLDRTLLTGGASDKIPVPEQFDIETIERQDDLTIDQKRWLLAINNPAKIPDGVTKDEEKQFLTDTEEFRQVFQDKLGPFNEYMQLFKSSLKLGVGISDNDVQIKFQPLIDAMLKGDRIEVARIVRNGVLGEDSLTYDNFDSSQQLLKSVQSSLDEYVKAGGDTSLISGTTESVINKLGEVDDPELVSLATKMRLQLINYVSTNNKGTATDADFARYAEIFPNTSSSPELIKSKIGAIVDTMEIQKNRPLEIKLGADKFNKLFGQDFQSSLEGSVVFTDQDGTEYTQETLFVELSRKITAGEATQEEVEQFIIDNNLN